MEHQFSVSQEPTIHELNGQSCLSLNNPETPTQQRISSRSFVGTLNNKKMVQQAVIFHLGRARRYVSKQP